MSYDLFPFLKLDILTTFILLGQVYSYSDRSDFSTYTQWSDITPQSNSSCVDMVFLVDQTGSMSSYYSAIDNLASNLPYSGETCQNQ